MTDAQTRTARRFPKPSPLLRWAIQEGKLPMPGQAIVVGAGLLVESYCLADLGWKVDALETQVSIERRSDVYQAFAKENGCRVIQLSHLRKRYLLAVITHVLEFVEDPVQRLQLLQTIATRLAKDGMLLLSLRGWSDVRAAKHSEPRGDGIVTGLGSWTRGFTMAEANELVASAGLEVAGTPQPRARIPEQVRLICREKQSTAS